MSLIKCQERESKCSEKYPLLINATANEDLTLPNHSTVYFKLVSLTKEVLFIEKLVC